MLSIYCISIVKLLLHGIEKEFKLPKIHIKRYDMIRKLLCRFVALHIKFYWSIYGIRRGKRANFNCSKPIEFLIALIDFWYLRMWWRFGGIYASGFKHDETIQLHKDIKKIKQISLSNTRNNSHDRSHILKTFKILWLIFYFWEWISKSASFSSR